MGAKGPISSRGGRVYDRAPFDDAPELGERPGGSDWPVQTLEWWDALSRLPHAASFEASDWAFARMTAHVHALTLEKATGALLAELRVREERLGATEVGRARLGIRYEDAPATPRRAARDGLRLVDRALPS